MLSNNEIKLFVSKKEIQKAYHHLECRKLPLTLLYTYNNISIIYLEINHMVNSFTVYMSRENNKIKYENIDVHQFVSCALFN